MVFYLKKRADRLYVRTRSRHWLHFEFDKKTEISMGSIPNGMYFIDGPYWVQLTVSFGTVPIVLVNYKA